MIWHNRYKNYHEGIKGKVLEITIFIKAYMVVIEHIKALTQIKCGRKSIYWERPEGEIIKLNFDASMDIHTYTSILGFVPRYKGLIMATCSYLWYNIKDPYMAEARACLQAISFVMDLGFRSICVEGDSGGII